MTLSILTHQSMVLYVYDTVSVDAYWFFSYKLEYWYENTLLTPVSATHQFAYPVQAYMGRHVLLILLFFSAENEIIYA